MGNRRTEDSTLNERERHEVALLLELAKLGESIQLAPGQLLFQEGERSEDLYILLDGQLKVFSTGRLEREVIYNIVQPIGLVGEMLLDGGSRSASVRAVDHAVCSKLCVKSFRSMMEINPMLGGLVVDLLISRLRKATQKIRSLALDSVYERVTSLLNEHAVPSEEGRTVPTFLTQQEIANRIGSSREMVNYVMRELIKGGFLVRPRARRLLIVRTLPSRW